MPCITLTLTNADTVYSASATPISVSTAGIQPHRDNADAIYFNEAEDPSANDKTGLELAAPVAGQQMAVLSLNGDNNPIQIAQLRFISNTAGQKVNIFYKKN